MTWAYRPRACCPARAPPPRKATADAHPGREPCWRTGKSPATAVPPLTAAQQQTGIIGGMLQAPSSLSAPAAEEAPRSEEHTSELQSPDHLVCRLLLEKKKQNKLI